jgi:hypothetical protein
MTDDKGNERLGGPSERREPQRAEPRHPTFRPDPAPSAGAGSGEHRAGERTEARAASKDIAHVLKGWDYESGTINVRRVHGADGKPKLQMRLDLGLLQMELTGRPDGARPHGCESLLEYFERELREHKTAQGSELGFHLTEEQCQSLREEAVMYYHRYVSLFVLEDYGGVVRDTARNLRVLDLCGRYAIKDEDRFILEQYRPYITMMNARAKASILFKGEKFPEAYKVVRDALASIKEFFTRFGHEEAYGHSSEVKVLKRFAKEIRRKLPVDPLARLQAQLEKAVKVENYEKAAWLRDEIKKMTEGASAGGNNEAGDSGLQPA